MPPARSPVLSSELRRAGGPQARVVRHAAPTGSIVTLTFRDARVHVHVRREAGALRVVAFCARRHAADVAHALAGVEQALRQSGERLVASVVPLGGAR
jgi:hypothetical protein